MKRLMTVMAALMMLATMATLADNPGGTLYREGTVVVPAGATNAWEEVSLFDRGTDNFQEIERVAVYNAGGQGTGTVSFLQFDLGAIHTTMGSYATLYSGQSGGGTPRYENAAGGSTNTLAYCARKVKVYVAQSLVATNATTYKYCIYTK